MDDYCSVTSLGTQDDPQEGPSSKRQKPTGIPTANRAINKKKTQTQTLAAARAALGAQIIPPPKPKK